MYMFEELGFIQMINLKPCMDCTGTPQFAKNTVNHDDVDARHHPVREITRNENLKLEHTSTDNMIVDVLTKGLSASNKHQCCINLLGLRKKIKKLLCSQVIATCIVFSLIFFTIDQKTSNK